MRCGRHGRAYRNATEGTRLSTQPSAGGPARQRGLPPVVDANTRVLVLGSFPGVASLAARQYYAHPRNHFWPIMAAILDEPLTDDALHRAACADEARGVGLWDIIVACQRKGSSDAAIRDAERGDVRRIHRVAHSLSAVCFNGNTAATAEPVWQRSRLCDVAHAVDEPGVHAFTCREACSVARHGALAVEDSGRLAGRCKRRPGVPCLTGFSRCAFCIGMNSAGAIGAARIGHFGRPPETAPNNARHAPG